MKISSYIKPEEVYITIISEDGVVYKATISEDQIPDNLKWEQDIRSSVTVRHTAESSKIREWANDNGYDINQRGKIPYAVRLAYSESLS